MRPIETLLALPKQALTLGRAGLSATAGHARAAWPLPILDMSDSSTWFEDEEL